MASTFITRVLTCAVLAAGSVSAVSPAVGAVPPPASEPLGAAATGSVYVPLAPCRVLDTRLAGGRIAAGEARRYRVTGPGAPGQGGNPAGCGVPDSATAIEASISAVTPQGTGWARAWPADQAPPAATFLNFSPGRSTTNTGAVPIAPGGGADLQLAGFGAPADYVLDVIGYYSVTSAIPTGQTGDVFVPVTPCRVVDTRHEPQPLQDRQTETYRVAGAGDAFSRQGGRANGCGVPLAATAVEASLTAVGPARTGYLRAWPREAPEPTGTIVNYSAGRSATNTGALGINTARSYTNTGEVHLTVQNHGGPTHLVIDVQGYYLPSSALPPATVGSLYVPLTPCRVADTRYGTKVPVALATATSLQVAGTGSRFLAQGGRAGGCGVPASAVGVVASISATAPQGTGFLRAWPSGTAPEASVLNYAAGHSSTNTAAIGLANGSTMVRAGTSPTHVVIDVQGYFRAPQPRPGTTTRVSVPDGTPDDPAISADGTTVAYALHPYFDHRAELWVRNQATGTSTKIGPLAADTASPTVSADGRFVAYSSGDSAAVPGDGNLSTDIYLWDRSSATTTAITTAGPTLLPSISGDGSAMTYAQMVNGTYEAFLWERAGDTTTPLTGTGASYAQISSDGSWISIETTEALLPTDTNQRRDIYLRERGTGTLTRVTDGNDESGGASLSADASTIAFSSLATNLTSEADANHGWDAFTWDRATGETTRITNAPAPSFGARMSQDGSTVLFSSQDATLSADDTNGLLDLFVWDRATNETIRITDGNQETSSGVPSADGRTVAYASAASNLIADDADAQTNIFLWKR